MLIGETLPFVKAYIQELDSVLRELDPHSGLSRHRQAWLGFCLLAVVMTNSVCWKRFERASLGRWSHAQLSWLFRQTNRFWCYLLQASVHVLLEQYQITEGLLVLDDSDNPRSKNTKRLYKTHRIRHKPNSMLSCETREENLFFLLR